MKPRLTTCALLLHCVLAGAAGATELTSRELDQLIKLYFAADHAERINLEARLGEHDHIDAHEIDGWQKKLLKLAREGGRSPLSGTNYLYDEKEKIGKYLVQSKKGDALVLGLHGGGAGSGDAGSALSGLGGALGKVGAVTVYPEVLRKTEYGWGEEDTERFVLDLIETIKRTRRIDTNRIYLTGHSMGGYGTWTIGARHADLFAGLAAFAGAPTPILDPADESRQIVLDIEEGILPNLRNLPIFVYQSLDDRNVPPWSNMFATRALAGLQQEYGGFEFVYEEVDGRGHSFPAKGPGPGIDWAMTHRRDPRPRKIVWQPVRSWKRMFYWLWWENPVLRSLLVAEVTGDNVVEITTEADVSGLSILVDERLFDLQRSIVVKVNGEVKFDAKVRDTLSTMLRTAAERNDPELLFRARVDL